MIDFFSTLKEKELLQKERDALKRDNAVLLIENAAMKIAINNLVTEIDQLKEKKEATTC